MCLCVCIEYVHIIVLIRLNFICMRKCKKQKMEIMCPLSITSILKLFSFFFLQYKTRAVHNFIYSGQYSVEEEFCVLSQNTHKRSKHIFVSYHHHRTKSVDGWKGG